VLEGKAQQKVSQVQADIVRARTLLETLKASYKRLQFLYEEYRTQGSGATAITHGMQDAMNHRQFMSQLMTLSERVVQDIDKATVALNALYKKMVEAEGERLKMQTLDEQEILAFQMLARKREQRSMDELGVSQFNRVGRS
jgi:flagellar export protein FliJ